MDNKDNKDFRCVMFANDSRHPKAPKFKIMFTINGKDYVSSVWLATNDTRSKSKQLKLGKNILLARFKQKKNLNKWQN